MTTQQSTHIFPLPASHHMLGQFLTEETIVATQGTCKTCGARWDVATGVGKSPSFFFSSATKAKGSYTSAAVILAANEAILTCPLDPVTPKSSEGRTPSGGRMQAGDDRTSAGDEVQPGGLV